MAAAPGPRAVLFVTPVERNSEVPEVKIPLISQ